MKKITLLLLFMATMVWFPINGHASDIPFSVRTILPENQLNKKVTYFDLLLSENQEQEIQLELTNSSDAEQKVKVEPNNATTNSNGVIEYKKVDKKKDSSMKYGLTDIISPAQEILLAPHEVKKISFKLKMPNEKMNGVILGGFYVSKLTTDSASEKKDEGVQLKNEFSYVVGVQVRQNENLVKPNLKLNNVKAGLKNYRTSILANLQNDQPTILKNLKVDVSIYKQGASEVLYSQKSEEMSVAPNSNFDYPIDLKNAEIIPGQYVLKGTASSGEQTWNLEKEFVIDNKVAKESNKEAVELVDAKPDYQTLLLIIVVANVVIIGILIYFLVIRKSKAKKTKLNY
ncbi:DUF916 and DUF3324 domain-containing protein [Carnobacterium maltaromaticum]|uniref:DUF916 and DUF3324 domain-containing protein n=1 Tax=Carnobacterium maltaromaticum TaxID=2751 RepID=A0AAW9K7L5_CARML|nr:DUF916 and DUF3324 domain-containing protein [Carnobacterium maltaromaticum]MDZ5759246.1 DUF916 and DUF3324 domain-containing protein [Carnobacterium maltaromaticum]